MKQLREIKNRWTGALIHSGEYNTLREAVVYCAANKINLRSAYLSDAYLRGAYLRDADLSGADLSGAVLRGADLSDDGKLPVIPQIHQKVFAAASAENALKMCTWHTCETTHCRAGWVVTLAGPAGAAMEWCLGTPAAAALIYQASDPTLEKIPDFYCTNEAALADMKRLAEAEAARG